VLRRYGGYFGEDPARWILATGNTDEILTFAQRFGVEVSPGRRPGTLEHGEAVAVFDRDERLTWLTAGDTWQPDEILAALESASGRRPNLLSLIRLWFENFGNTCGAVLGEAVPSWRRPLSFALVFATLLASMTLIRMVWQMLPAKAGPRQR
jgi:hypothetical protein